MGRAMKPQPLIEYFQELLKDVPEGQYVVVDLTMKKKGDGFLIAEGDPFGPYVLQPKTIPE
jgi:hypothetical protein